MIKELHITNFRCFSDHTISFRPMTIIVGKNNAGKSTIVEALRIVSLLTDTYPHRQFRHPPEEFWGHISRYRKGVSPAIKKLKFKFDNVFHRYGDPPSNISAKFDTGTQVDVFIGRDGTLFAVFTSSDGSPIDSYRHALLNPIPQISALPQVVPLQQHEHILDPEYVRESLSTHLTPLHFRNQLKLFHNYFHEFKRLAEATWPGLDIMPIEERHGEKHTDIILNLRDSDYFGEVAAMGHGLQMWLQTLWFLARTSDSRTIILDEPDVYMHADLQRRLVKLVRSRNPQTIIATHSVEILAEVAPDQVLIIDRTHDKSEYADTLPAVQAAITSLGGVYNVQVTRLWSSDKMLVVEGKDVEILDRLYSTLFPNRAETLSSIPHTSVGGWGGWMQPFAKEMPFRNGDGNLMTTYFIFDSDYYTDEDIAQRYIEAKNRNVYLHVWRQKEIENYLLIPAAICRIITEGLLIGVKPPSEEDIITQINLVCDALRDDVTGNVAHQINIKVKNVKQSAMMAFSYVKAKWDNQQSRWSCVGGKSIISALSGWSKEAFGVQFSPTRVAQAIDAHEVPDEVKAILSAIEARKLTHLILKEINIKNAL